VTANFLTASEAARMLALSERTLHRRLAEEGTRFSAMIDEGAMPARANSDGQATWRSSRSRWPFVQPPSSFSRAFKRWSGNGRPRIPAADAGQVRSLRLCLPPVRLA